MHCQGLSLARRTVLAYHETMNNGMDTLRHLYRIGMGPSSSHTLAPRRAAALYRQKHPTGPWQVTLYGSLAATGIGHLTHQAIREKLEEALILSKPDEVLPEHPNGMEFFTPAEGESSRWRVFSTGGGALSSDNLPDPAPYPLSTMNGLLKWSRKEGKPLWMYAPECEGQEILTFLEEIRTAMEESIRRGSDQEGVLPGGLNLARKSANLLTRSQYLPPDLKRTALISGYALAVSEENAAGGVVVTAPTCGASGVLPALLAYLARKESINPEKIVHALAVAGLVGNIIKTNASISGAEVGCQGEVGAACAMAAAAGAQLLGGSAAQIEYAAEMGLEHHLGLTCDPVKGLVQIPCIERNAMAATRALDCAEYALLSDGSHRISFDQVVQTMSETGHDIPSLYRETSLGGLARTSRESGQE